MVKRAALFASLLFWFFFAAVFPAAAASFRITLADGTELIGVVQSFEDGIYKIATASGEKTIAADDVRGMEVMDAGPVPAGAAEGGAPASAPVPEVTILTGDGQMIVGRLLSFEEGVYEIGTKSGDVTVPVDKVQKVEIAWLQSPNAARPAPGAAALSAGTLRLAGSSAMSESVAPALLEGFVGAGGGQNMRWSRGTAAALRVLTAVPGGQGKFTAEMRVRNSAAAVDALVRGEAEIGMMSRPMTPDEAERIAAANLGKAISAEQEYAVAPGGAVVIVHPSNPIKSLSLELIAGIFSGKLRSWGDVGGPARRIQLYVPAAGAGILSVLQRRVLGESPLLETAKSVASNVEMAEIIAADPAAIGLVEFAHIGNAAPVSITDACGVTHTPSPFGILTEEYPLSTRLYFYTTAQPSSLTREFLNYAVSNAGQQAIAERGFVSLSPAVDAKNSVRQPATAAAAQKTAAEQRIAADLARLANAASRVSVAFHFGFAGAEIDPRGETDIDRLATFLKGQTTSERRRVAIVGFSDGSGPLENNVKLSERRAKLVAQKLGQKGVTPDLVVGFGALLPLACGVAPDAAIKNRRVEAWLY